MLVPTKFTALEESTIFKMRAILAGRNDGETICELLSRTRNFFFDASEFLHAVDILYVLGKLDVVDETSVVNYAN